ncbi:MAG TPA: phosphomannomutase/phosphoglucomutase, partial [Rhodanobacteraceae bacterium]|nr:phosphomannomutase/phosphoglucomutase [Rhodanobacteraceae bacterium]
MNTVGKPNFGSLRARFNRHRGAAEVAADIAFALMLLLLLLALFMGWQTWLIARESAAGQSLAQDKAQALARVTAAVSAQRAEVDRALADPRLLTALDGGDPASREHAAQLLRVLLPDARDAAFYSASLDEVLKGNLQQIGYARASQLMRAQGANAAAPVEVRARTPQIVSYAQPIVEHGATLAYAVVDMPFTGIRSAFDAITVDAGRLDLREGDGNGDLLLATRGNGGVSTDSDTGTPVPRSRLRIAAAAPAYWLPVTQSLIGAAVLTGLALILAIALFVARARIRARSAAVIAEEPSLADIAQAAPAKKIETPATAPAAVAPAAEKPRQPSVVDRGIFRAYDIRGVVGKTLTEDTARAIGRAIGSVMHDKNLSEIVIGRDGRLSGPQMAGALIEGLRSAGIDVIDIGLAPTPVTYFASFHLNTGSCVSVTGSHNPPDYNGFKIVVGGETLAEDAIQGLYARIAERRLVEGHGSLRQLDVAEDYVQRIASDIQTGRALKVVVDCGNGIAGNVVPQVIQAIGCEAIPLYCDVDGNFPHHHPDPSNPENLADLILMVKKTGADLG